MEEDKSRVEQSIAVITAILYDIIITVLSNTRYLPLVEVETFSEEEELLLSLLEEVPGSGHL